MGGDHFFCRAVPCLLGSWWISKPGVFPSSYDKLHHWFGSGVLGLSEVSGKSSCWLTSDQRQRWKHHTASKTEAKESVEIANGFDNYCGIGIGLVSLTHCARLDAAAISYKHFLTCTKDKCNEHFIWNWPLVNDTGFHGWLVNICSGSGLMPSGKKPLTEQELTRFGVAIYREATLS